jgi:hypothetical protein
MTDTAPSPGWWKATSGTWYPPEMYPSDTPRGDDWWIAGDGKWYPPQFHPDYVAPVTPPPSPVTEPVPSEEPVFTPAPPATIAAPVPTLPTVPTVPAGWWLAADGQWYPPERHPDYHPPPPPSPFPPSTSPAVMTSSANALQAGAWITIIGSVLLGLGTILPWVHATAGLLTVDRNAFQLGNQEALTFTGPVLIILAIIGIAIGVARLTRSDVPRGIQRSPVVLGIGMVAVTAFSYPIRPAGLTSSIAGVDITWAISYGFWLCAIGGVVVFFGGLSLRSSAKAAA